MNLPFDEVCAQIKAAFADCEDFVNRENGENGSRVALMFLKGITSRDYISERILRPLLKTDLKQFDGNFAAVIECPNMSSADSQSEAAEAIARGDVFIAAESGSGAFYTLANAEFSHGRSIQEPSSDVTIRGPKAGFVENAETNMALLRKYVKNSALKFKSFTVGEVSRSKVIIAYIDGRADAKLVEEIANKIKNIDASVITDSTNISMLLDGNRNPPLPSCGSSEKVDKVASKLMAGRVGIIVDGSPFVLTIPFLFIEGLQSSEDYLHTPYYATFIRILRLFAFAASIFAPAILCVAVKSDYTSLPHEVYGIIIESRKDIPLSFFGEICAVLLLFELLREVGVRMPRTVGDAVGIVGSIILGNTAVEAGLVSSVGVITVAFSAVCAFVTPAYMYVIVIARLIVLVLAEIFGIYGIGLAVTGLLLFLCGKKSFGVPYMFPFSPYDKKGMEDYIFSWPKRTLGRKESLDRKQ